MIGSAVSWQELATTENLFVPSTGSATMTCKMYYARGLRERAGTWDEKKIGCCAERNMLLGLWTHSTLVQTHVPNYSF